MVKFFFKIFNILQEFAPFLPKLETRRKPETRQCKTRTRLSKLAKTRPDPDCPKPEPARPRLFQTRSITRVDTLVTKAHFTARLTDKFFPFDIESQNFEVVKKKL